MIKQKNIFSAVLLFLGLLIGAYILGKSFERFRKEDRYISVKGFSEREVKADLVIWSIKIRMVNNDLIEGHAALESAKTKVIEFLKNKGVDAKEIIPMNLAVTDRQANEYGQVNQSDRFRYIIEESIEVRSNQVDSIQKISRMTSELLNAGVALSTKDEWRGSGLKFIFTKLNAIKPEMLAEAIQNAKGAAEQFTKESNTYLGKLRKASQGLFSIQDRDASLSGAPEGDYYSGSTSDLYKKVRVVISVDYSIE